MGPGMWLTARTRTGSGRSSTVAGTALATLLASSLAAVLAVAFAGCASPVFAPGGSLSPSSSDAPRPRDLIHQQAQDALARWADAVRASGGATITFVGELTSQIGDWEAENGDNKVALMAGAVESMTDLPTDTPGRREVKWLDDTKIDVNVMSAEATLEELVAGGTGDCTDDCTPLRVTEANLATGLVETSRGPAEAPIWVYGLAGTSVRITRIAVDESVTVVPPAWNADHPPVGISIDSAMGASDSRDIQVSFVGAPDDGSKPCGADYTAEAVESDLAVVVIVEEHRNPTPGACTLVGAIRIVAFRLESRLGDRAVLEVLQGLPVSVEAPPA
jgi:hypothetical protein